MQPVTRQAATGGALILNPCGWGNLGDAAIVASVIRALRRRQPDYPLVALTLNPADTAKRHGVPAYTCTGFSREHYGIASNRPYALPGEAEEVESFQASNKMPLSKRVRVKLGPAVAPLLPITRGLSEARHARWLHTELGKPRIVVVAGGGQLDDFWGGAFGHPYVLWRWAQFARASRCRYVVLSVGTGSLSTPAARWFVRSALSLAEYRSYRDDGSRALLDDPRVANDPIVPDLAFGLPLGEPATPSFGSGLRIGVVPIAHCDPRSWPVKDARRYESYVNRLADLCARLLQRNANLTLLTTDEPDLATLDDVYAATARLVSPHALERVERPAVRTHEELLERLQSYDLLVASRLHAALLSHLQQVPVAAISYERKVTKLLTDAGHQAYCVHIDDFTPEDLDARVGQMLERRQELVDELTRHVTQLHESVERQYDLVFGPVRDE